MKRYVFPLFFLCAVAAWGQTEETADLSTDVVSDSVWSLSRCIAHAKQENLSIRKSRLSSASSQVDLELAKAAWWPTLSFATTQQLRYVPFADYGSSGTGGTASSTSDKLTASGSYGLNFNWTVWNGSRQKNISRQKVETQISELAVAETENEITEAVMLDYLQVLYAEENMRVKDSTVQVSEQLRDRAEAMQRVGSISASEYAQVASQYATDLYNFVSAQADYKNNLLLLKQLLELHDETPMVLQADATTDEQLLAPLPAKADVYAAAVGQRPEIQSSQLGVESADIYISQAKGGYMPSIALSAGSSLSHSSGGDVSVAEQMVKGWNNSVGLTLSVPIVDGRQTKSAVEKAKLSKQTAELNLQEQQKTLYKTIENLWLSANSAQQEYTAAKIKLEAAQKSYNLIVEQFKVGAKHATDLAESKSSYLQAQQQMLQAKYNAMYAINMLDFYQGKL